MELVLPVRFVADGQAVQCTTREVTAAAAFVSCPTPPRPGATISLRIYFPGDRAPHEVAATVREATAAGDPRGSGFWADFLPGNDAARHRIAALVSRAPRLVPTPTATPRVTPHQTPPVPPARLPTPSTLPKLQPVALAPDRRTDRRVLGGALPVRFSTVEDFVLEYAANISAGGVFIKTAAPPPLETKVRVRLELPDGGPPIEADGIVTHRLEPREAGERREPGAGVQFLRTDEEFRTRVERFLDAVLAGKS